MLSTFSVINIADSGAGSLRQAMQDANASAGVSDVVSFNIPGAGVHTIQPLSALPTITSPVTIDGYTQPGSSTNTLATGDNALINIELKGSSTPAGTNGFVITAGNSTIRGLAIFSFPNQGILLAGAGGNVVEGNFIGTDATGSVRRGNAGPGVYIETSGGVASIGNRIGTDATGFGGPAARNLFIGNGSGVYIQRVGIPASTAPADNNVIAGNFFGTDRTGTITNPDNLPNSGDELGNGVAIRLLTTSYNTIGGTNSAARKATGQ